jgi:haloacid dehalogenase superfamily, subfamily IA, variant 3 with third motif having DD or ED
MQNIDTLLFDFGGVIVNVDYTLMIRAFAQYNIKNFDHIYTQDGQVELIDLFEEGKISMQEFHDGIRDLLSTPLTDKQIDDAWFSMILDLPKERIDLLGELKKKYKLYLFSNTNELHIERLKRMYHQQFGFDIFKDLFIKAYFSNEIHQKKPNPCAFQWVINDSGINPATTLFIEDSPQHIEGAKQVGLNTYWLTKGQTIIDLHNKNII